MINTKILFLDFDGVLKSFDNQRCLDRLHSIDSTQFKSKDKYGDLFDDRGLLNIAD